MVVPALSDGECALLADLRFHAGEKENDADFAEALARLGDLHVKDAFSAATGRMLRSSDWRNGCHRRPSG